MLSLLRRDDGKTSVEIRSRRSCSRRSVELAKDEIGLPVPNFTEGFGATGSSDSVRRKVEGQGEGRPARGASLLPPRACGAELEGGGGRRRLSDGKSTLDSFLPGSRRAARAGPKIRSHLRHSAAQLTRRALAARAKAKKEATTRNSARDAEASAKQVIAADEATAESRRPPTCPMRRCARLAGQTTPVPLPEDAENVKFDGAERQARFNSASSVKALAAFYRGSLKSLGWKESPRSSTSPTWS